MPNIHMLFELAPIGVNGAMEAVAAYGFCRESCAAAFAAKRGDTTFSAAFGPNTFAEGHLCDHCGRLLEPSDSSAV